jgi:23S rRNA (uracil1939-C5)-methyltransferase
MKRINVAPEEADIVDLSHEARGVARIAGKTVFVADSLPASASCYDASCASQLRRSVTEQVLQASPDRVSALPALRHRGGCALQHPMRTRSSL